MNRVSEFLAKWSTTVVSAAVAGVVGSLAFLLALLIVQPRETQILSERIRVVEKQLDAGSATAGQAAVQKDLEEKLAEHSAELAQSRARENIAREVATHQLRTASEIFAGLRPASASLEQQIREVAVDPNVVDMLFATTRKAELSATKIEFTRSRASELLFGTLRVRVPEAHKIGRIELPISRNFILFRYEQRSDPKRHFIIRDITILDREKFVEIAKETDSNTALIFVHGFNNTFEYAEVLLDQINY